MAEIDVERLTKSFGTVRAVDDLSFSVHAGQVVGLLGREAAGKTTTLACLLGLLTPTSGTATIAGVRHRDLPDPPGTVGAVLQTAGFHPGRTARDHLRIRCVASRLPEARADACLEQVALTDLADRRTGGLAVGARQRLALATALLGDPEVLVLDEPAAGFDLAAMHWLRGFLRRSADEGRAVLVASRALSEVERAADSVVVIGGGRLVGQASLGELARDADAAIRVRTVQIDELTVALTQAGARVERVAPDTLRVLGATSDDVGVVARQAGVAVRGLWQETTEPEEAVLELLRDPTLEDAQ